ncbi:MAG TPA: LUD domain-containing protein [Nitrolancea sp.]|jgi:iron-sulfur cluster protein|nr:LUD domain-containing protein [Nitrolancea sp.]
MPARSKEFQRRLDAAVDDPNLATALHRALSTFRARRNGAFAELDFAAMRADMHERKADAIARLPELIDQFTREAEAVGAVVHLARTPEDACRIIGDLAAERKIKLAVKSKSMATEEIRLNDYLEKRGVDAVETDLGEWIIQLAGEHPSHLIAPAIHKTREEVAQVFSKKLKIKKVSDDPKEMVKIARARLRQSFIDAGMGITGANVAIADTGTIGIVTNEGNERFVATLPPIHVAVLGVEKIVPTIDDAVAMLKLLPRSGTAQKITSYVSFITGPSRSSDIELVSVVGVHGPTEMHIVLLDNGRLEARLDPELVDTLYCIRCGACSNVCPPYQVVGGHSFGYIYTGPIGLPLTAIHHGLGNVADPQSLCVSCNACETVCPAQIPIPRLILEVRARVTETYGLQRVKEEAFERWTDPEDGDRWVRRAALAAAPFKDDDGFIEKIPLQKKLTRDRHLIAPARRPLRDRAERIIRDGKRTTPRIPQSKATGLRVAYFPGCLTDRVLPDMGAATIRVLQACGCEVSFPQEQHCCGLVALNSGDRPRGRIMAEQTIAMLENVQADWIATNSTSCFAAMVQDYQTLFQDAPGWRERAAKQAKRLIDVTTFLDEVAQLEAMTWTTPGPRVTYHDACQSNNALGIHAAPRRLITDVLGLELTEMHDSNVCCGFGGSFSTDYPAVSSIIAGRKLDNAEQTGTGVIVADNPGCLMQIRGALHARHSPMRALHLVELIDERLRDLK